MYNYVFNMVKRALYHSLKKNKTAALLSQSGLNCITIKATVTLQQEQNEWELYIPARGATRHTPANAHKVMYDVESKVFKITSEVPVTVYLEQIVTRHIVFR